MQHYLSAHIEADDWKEAAQQAIAQLGAIPPNCHLGFIYITDRLANSAGRILDYLREHTPVRQWVGTIAGGVCSNGHESFDQSALVLMVTDLDETQFKIIPGIDSNPAKALMPFGAWRAQHQPHFAVVHGDPRNPETAQLINRLAHSIEGGFLAGGVSSGNSENFVQFAGDELTEGGISGVLLSGSVSIASGISQGCHLIGKPHRITEVERNVIQRIDNRPALEVLFEEVGETMANDPKLMQGHIFAGLHVPSSDTRDYLIRNLLALDLHHQQVSIGDVPEQGTSIQFAKRDALSAREDLVRMITELKSRIKGRIKGALYYSCCGRGQLLFGGNSAELTVVRETLGDVPLAGFFANGEISHDRLYGYIGALTLFLETE